MPSRKDFMKMLGWAALGSGVLARGALGAAGRSGETHDQTAAYGGTKITGVDIHPMDIEIKKPFTIAIGTITAANDILIRVHTDAGITGIGEACPALPITGETQEACLSAARDMRKLVLGRDPTAIGSILGSFGPFFHTAPSVAAAYDMALYDIVGKMAGLPVFRLLGGDDPVFETDRTVSIDHPAEMAELAAGFVSRGFHIVKVKVGQDPDADVERVRAVREAVGEGTRLRIDANQGWTVPQAISTLKRMEKYGLEFAEQPVVAWDVAGLKSVRDESPIPIMADEAVFRPEDALRLVRAEACHYINIKLMKAGGIANSIRISNIAESANVKCMVGCMNESRIALAAGAHCVASQKNIIFSDLDGDEEHRKDHVVDGFTIKDGRIVLNERPGLGVDIDPDYLKTLKKV